MIVDVGANVGNTVAEYRSVFPDAHVYAIEPFEPMYEKLLVRYRGDGRVHPFNLAVGSIAKTQTLYLNEYADTNSLLPRPSRGRRYYAADNLAVGNTPVQVITLDDFARQNQILHIDILKLDIQGGEADALAGARELLSDSRIDLILSEVFFVPHYEGARLFHEITAQLAKYRYTLYHLTHLISARNGQLRFADAIYVSASIRENVIDAWPAEA